MKLLQTISGAFLALCSMFFSTAYAAVPLGVDTAITTAKDDAVVIAGYVLIALAGLVAVKWMIKVVRGA